MLIFEVCVRIIRNLKSVVGMRRLIIMLAGLLALGSTLSQDHINSNTSKNSKDSTIEEGINHVAGAVKSIWRGGLNVMKSGLSMFGDVFYLGSHIGESKQETNDPPLHNRKSYQYTAKKIFPLVSRLQRRSERLPSSEQSLQLINQDKKLHDEDMVKLDSKVADDITGNTGSDNVSNDKLADNHEHSEN